MESSYNNDDPFFAKSPIKRAHNKHLTEAMNYLSQNGTKIFGTFPTGEKGLRFTTVIVGGAAIKYHLFNNPNSPVPNEIEAIFTPDIDLKFVFDDLSEAAQKRGSKTATTSILYVRNQIIDAICHHMNKKLEHNDEGCNRVLVVDQFNRKPLYLRSVILEYLGGALKPLVDTTIYNTDGVYMNHYSDFRRIYYNKDTGYPVEFVTLDNMNIASIKFLAYDTLRMFILSYHRVKNTVIDKVDHKYIEKVISYAFKVVLVDWMDVDDGKPRSRPQQQSAKFYHEAKKNITGILYKELVSIEEVKAHIENLYKFVNKNYSTKLPISSQKGGSLMAAVQRRRLSSAAASLLAQQQKQKQKATPEPQQQLYSSSRRLFEKIMSNAKLEQIIYKVPGVEELCPYFFVSNK